MTARAIFLSYASQDADAARRICDALRAAGLEVWFDQSELRGGDAWDASIRKQIKECALFVPIISANTNARREGYFRLEWKLAVERTHLMEDNMPFLMPVLLAGTPEATALVPDKFRERQWTHVGDEASISAFVARARLLIDAPVLVDASPNAHQDGAKAIATASLHQPTLVKSRRGLLVLGASAVAAGVGLSLWRPWQKTSDAFNADGPKDPQLQRAAQLIEKLNGVESDVTLAEDLVKGVLSARPTDTEATVMMARVQVYFILRGFDVSEDRFGLAKRYTERALALAPNDPEAMVAMARYLGSRRVEPERARKLVDDAVALRPDTVAFHRLRNGLLSSKPGITNEDVIAAMKATAVRFPNDALVHHGLGIQYGSAAMFAEAAVAYGRAVELGPITNSITALVAIKLWTEGDVAGAKAILERVPAGQRTLDRVVIRTFDVALISGEIEVGLAALRSVSAAWIIDIIYTGPTALLVGELLLRQGKVELSRLRFEEAYGELRKQMQASSLSAKDTWLEPYLLMRLGKMREARARNAVYFTELKRPYRLSFAFTGWWVFTAIPINLLLGERGKAIDLMREASATPTGRLVMRNAMRLDPRMTPFRNDAEIVKLLAEPTTENVAKK